MIRRPPKRFGGALQEEFDKLWDAMQRVQISSATGLEMDQTTNGTMIRVQPRAAAAPDVPGAFFKVVSAAAGNPFDVQKKDAAGVWDGNPPSGLCGKGLKMESFCTSVPPSGLNYNPTFGAEEHVLVWQAAQEIPKPAETPVPIGTIVFAVLTELSKNFTGTNVTGLPIPAPKKFWYVLPFVATTPPPPPGSAPWLDNPTVSHGLFGDPVEEGTVVTWSAQGRADFNYEPITIEWTRDVGFGPEVMFSSSLTNGMGTFMLTVTLADSGTYSVVATNSSGSSDVQTFTLNVVPAQ